MTRRASAKCRASACWRNRTAERGQGVLQRTWNLNSFTELKRRNVFRVAGLYAVVGWVVAQVADTFFTGLGLPVWTVTLLNEYSARYSLMPVLYYTPERDHFALQSRSDRQGRDQAASEEVYGEAVRRWEELRLRAS